MSFTEVVGEDVMNDCGLRGKDLMKEIARVIRSRPNQFSMRFFKHIGGCQTTHCIGGYAAALTGSDDMSNQDRMREVLGLTEEEGIKLFNGRGPAWSAVGVNRYTRMYEITAKQAASVLERVASGELSLS